MRRSFLAVLVLALLGLVLTPATAPPAGAQAAATVQVAEHPQLGRILVDARGRTLYVFLRDEPNVSNCYDQCAQTWPPLLLSGSEQPSAGPGVGGELGTTTRRDNTRQVTYNGMPLYFYVRDDDPGDAYGQGVGNVWFVVPPGATRQSFPPSGASQPAAPAAAQPAAAAPAGAQPTRPSAATPAQLPRTGGPVLDATIVALGAALLGVGLGLRRRRG